MEEGLKINVAVDVEKALAGLDLVFESVKRFSSITNISLGNLAGQLNQISASGTGAANSLSNQFAPSINEAVAAAKAAEKVLSRIPLYLSPGGNTKSLDALGAAFKKLRTDIGQGIVTIDVQTGASRKNLADLKTEAKQLEAALNVTRSSAQQEDLRSRLAATKAEIKAISSTNFAKTFTDANAAMFGTVGASTAVVSALSKIQSALNFSPGNGVRSVSELGAAFRQLKVDLGTGNYTISIRTDLAQQNLTELRQEAARVKEALALSKDSSEQLALRGRLAAIANEMDRIASGNIAATFRQNTGAMRETSQAAKIVSDALAKIPAVLNIQAKASGIAELTAKFTAFKAASKDTPTVILVNTQAAQKSVRDLEVHLQNLERLFDQTSNSAQRIQIGAQIASVKRDLKEIASLKAPAVLNETATAFNRVGTAAQAAGLALARVQAPLEIQGKVQSLAALSSAVRQVKADISDGKLVIVVDTKNSVQSITELRVEQQRLEALFAQSKSAAEQGKLASAIAGVKAQLKAIQSVRIDTNATAVATAFQNVATSVKQSASIIITASAEVNRGAQLQAAIQQFDILKREAAGVATAFSRIPAAISGQYNTTGLVAVRAIVKGIKDDLANLSSTARVTVDATPALRSLNQLTAEASRLRGLFNSSTDIAEMKRLASSIHQVEQEAEKLNRIQLNRGFNGLGRTTKEAGVAMQNFGRVISDMPYGFIAIQNNIEPLFESFQRLGATAKATGGTMLGTFIKSLWSPTGAIVGLSALSAGLTYAIQKYGSFTAALSAGADLFRSFDAGRVALRALNAELDKAGESFGKEIANATRYSTIIKDVNSSTIDRQAAVRGLTDMIRSNLPLQEQELAITQALKGETTALVQALIARAKASAGEAAIAKTAAPLVELALEQKRVTEELTVAEAALAAERKKNNNQGVTSPLFKLPVAPGAPATVPIFYVTEAEKLVSDLKLKDAELKKETSNINKTLQELATVISGENKFTASESDDARLKQITRLKEQFESLTKVQDASGKRLKLNAVEQQAYNSLLAEEYQIKARIESVDPKVAKIVFNAILEGRYSVDVNAESTKANTAMDRATERIAKSMDAWNKKLRDAIVKGVNNANVNVAKFMKEEAFKLDTYYDQVEKNVREGIEARKPLVEKLIEQGLVDLPKSDLSNPTFDLPDFKIPKNRRDGVKLFESEADQFIRALKRIEQAQIDPEDYGWMTDMGARMVLANDALKVFNENLKKAMEISDVVAQPLISVFDQMTEKGAVFGDVMKNVLLDLGKQIAAATIKAAVFAAIMSSISGGIPGGGGFFKIFTASLQGGGGIGAMIAKLIGGRGSQANLGNRNIQQRTNQAAPSMQVVGVVRGTDLMLIQQRTYSNNRRTN